MSVKAVDINIHRDIEVFYSRKKGNHISISVIDENKVMYYGNADDFGPARERLEIETDNDHIPQDVYDYILNLVEVILADL